jgi:hypothetical protein
VSITDAPISGAVICLRIQKQKLFNIRNQILTVSYPSSTDPSTTRNNITTEATNPEGVLIEDLPFVKGRDGSLLVFPVVDEAVEEAAPTLSEPSRSPNSKRGNQER